jgi:hypothetical protein
MLEKALSLSVFSTVIVGQKFTLRKPVSIGVRACPKARGSRDFFGKPCVTIHYTNRIFKFFISTFSTL